MPKDRLGYASLRLGSQTIDSVEDIISHALRERDETNRHCLLYLHWFAQRERADASRV